jgi:hypothetical protein
MSTTTVPPVLATQPSCSFGAGRVLLLVFGSIAVLIALALLAGGGAAVWGLGQRDGSGYFTSDSHRLSMTSYAFASDNLDVGTDAPGWVFGDHFATVRIEASSTRPVFIGIARTGAVERYLAGVQHDQIRDFELDPFSVSYRHRDGSVGPAAPASSRRARICCGRWCRRWLTSTSKTSPKSIGTPAKPEQKPEQSVSTTENVDGRGPAAPRRVRGEGHPAPASPLTLPTLCSSTCVRAARLRDS